MKDALYNLPETTAKFRNAPSLTIDIKEDFFEEVSDDSKRQGIEKLLYHLA